MSNDIERQFSKSKEYYKILGLNSNCTSDQIKQSFLTLCKRYHPDNKVTGDKDKFILLREAYEIVKDVNSRYIYDRFLDLKGATSHATHFQTRARTATTSRPFRGGPGGRDNKRTCSFADAKENFKPREAGWQEPWQSMKRPFEDKYGHRYNKSYGARNMIALTIAMTSFIYLFIGSSLFELSRSNLRKSRMIEQQNIARYNSFVEGKAVQQAKEEEDSEKKPW